MKSSNNIEARGDVFSKWDIYQPQGKIDETPQDESPNDRGTRVSTSGKEPGSVPGEEKKCMELPTSSKPYIG